MAKMVIMMVLSVLATTSLITTEAQSTPAIPSCASMLTSCANYFTTNTTPSSVCCYSIINAMYTDLSCLCTLYNTPGLFESLGFTVAQALRVSQACGVVANLGACNATVSANSPTSSVAPPPPAVPGNDGGISASKIAWTGVLSLFLFWASMVLY
ncbi:LTP_2 domain-containing protein [Cephalotus follicularis]|uniref:LTP_2 domain-containing protein n=1 Tax=Cephalotus follicularis TaxID=3775 RepID=A0A1Q3D709_CEPFO|nr:LTP_2 domain-containing protein [Cephalotus follicularis]